MNLSTSSYIQRKGDPLHPKYANVVDGCSFLTKDPAVGCFQIWMTVDVSSLLSPRVFLPQTLFTLCSLCRCFGFLWNPSSALHVIRSYSSWDRCLDDWRHLHLELVSFNFTKTFNGTTDPISTGVMFSNNELGDKTKNGPV